MHRKKGFYSIQFLLSVVIFILMLFGAIIALMLKTEFFFKRLGEKNEYINIISISENFNRILYVKPYLTLNITTLKLINDCYVAMQDPKKGIHNNPQYDKLKLYLKIPDENLLTIYVTKYLLLTADKKKNALEREGVFNNSFSFKIWREDTHYFYQNFTLGSVNYLVGDEVTVGSEKYLLDYINSRTGLFAILKKEEAKCGLDPKKQTSKTFIFYRYAPHYNALYEFKVIVW